MRKFEIKEEDVIDIDNYIKERSNIKKEISLLKQNRRELKMVKTKAGVNHNSPGQYSKAYLIPFRILDDLALMKIPSPVRRD